MLRVQKCSKLLSTVQCCLFRKMPILSPFRRNNYLKTHRRFGIKKIKETDIVDYFHHSFDNIGAFSPQTKPLVLNFPSL